MNSATHTDHKNVVQKVIVICASLVLGYGVQALGSMHELYSLRNLKMYKPHQIEDESISFTPSHSTLDTTFPT